MGKVFTETHLADEVRFQIVRYRLPDNSFSYSIVLRATTVDGSTGDVIKEYAFSDIFNRLPLLIQNNLVNFLNRVIDKVAELLGVAPSN